MSLRDYQKQVDDWVNQFKIKYFKPEFIALAIQEEVGELSKEINNIYGSRTKKSEKDTADMKMEISDIIFDLICLANSHNIDLDEAWKRKMDKCYGRDKDMYEKK